MTSRDVTYITMPETAALLYCNPRTIRSWKRSGRLQLCKWDSITRGWGWYTTVELARLALANYWTDGQKEANKVANELMGEFGLERVL